MSQSTPTKHDGRAVLLAVAELLVLLCNGIRKIGSTWHPFRFTVYV